MRIEAASPTREREEQNAVHVWMNNRKGDMRNVIVIESSASEQGTIDLPGDVGRDHNWLGHSFSTSELPPTPIVLRFDEGDGDELKTTDVVVLKKCDDSSKALYNVSPLDDSTIPSLSLELLT